MAAARASLRAAAMETRVLACGEPTINMVEINQHSPCSVRVHGSVAICVETLKIGDSRSTTAEPSLFRKFDHRMDVKGPSLFRSYEACRKLIHRMLAESPVTDKCDLAADNWEEFQPHDIATTVVARVRRDTEDRRGVVPAYALAIAMGLHVRLIYSEPVALLLACKEAADAEAEVVPSGDELCCSICMLDVEIEEDETVRLPCSHAFHDRCILPWFHRASTCPTCRRDIMECVLPRRAHRAVCHLFVGPGKERRGLFEAAATKKSRDGEILPEVPPLNGSRPHSSASRG